MNLNRKTLIVTFAIIGLLFFGSCKDKLQSTIKGSWSLDEIHYNQYDVTRCLLFNVISFEQDGCILPITGECDDLTEWTKNGSWKVSKTDSNGVVLTITSANRIFSGSHKVIFYNDESNRLLRMELVSDSTYLLCRKGLFDYDNNIHLVDELVNLTAVSDQRKQITN